MSHYDEGVVFCVPVTAEKMPWVKEEQEEQHKDDETFDEDAFLKRKISVPSSENTSCILLKTFLGSTFDITYEPYDFKKSV